MNEPLSAREIEILQLAADGLANGEIANRLALSLNTVKWYSKRIYEKLAVESRAQALKRAETLGLLGGSSQPIPAAQLVHNLPAALTSLVGRRSEIDTVKQLLKQHRLLTLTGPGGIGKTRLALQVAEELSGFFPDGLCFVDLSLINDAALVPNAIARPLNVAESRTTPLTTLLQTVLHDKRFLLVLDNFEHLLEAAPLVVELLAVCQHLKVLVTSREVLALYGEREYPVPPLQLPDLEWFATDHLPAANLIDSEALQLFERSAQAAYPNFRITAENAAAVASICLRLDGLPLAIELAAAYSKLFTPQSILNQLESTWLEMKRSLRNIPARQQTLRNAIEWSYRFLNNAERQLFAQLAVFRGGCTWESIAAICSSTTPLALLEPLNSLVNKSLVWRRAMPDNEPRLGMLETIHQYAQSCLQQEGGQAVLQARHAHYFLELAEQAAPHLIGAQQQSWLARLEIEHPNLRAALQHLLATQQNELALRLATALYRFWEYRGYVGEGRSWLQQALAQSELLKAPKMVAAALIAAGWLAFRQGELEQARLYFAESLQLFEQAEEQHGIAEALHLLGKMDTHQGNYAAAQQHLEHSLQLARGLHYEHGIAEALQGLGGLAWDLDRYSEGREYYRESLELLRRLEHKVSIAAASLNIGNTERMLGNLDAANLHYQEALEIARGLGHPGLIGASLKNLSLLAFRQKDYAKARTDGEEALRIFRSLGDKSHIAFALSNVGGIAAKYGEVRQALSYWGEELQIMVEIGYKWPIFEALESIAELLAHINQQSACAVRLLAAADALHEETGIPIAPHRQEQVAEAKARLHQQVDDLTFATQWAQGRTAPLEEIVDEVKKLALQVESK